MHKGLWHSTCRMILQKEHKRIDIRTIEIVAKELLEQQGANRISTALKKILKVATNLEPSNFCDQLRFGGRKPTRYHCANHPILIVERGDWVYDLVRRFWQTRGVGGMRN
jgi:hypothetical protein